MVELDGVYDADSLGGGIYGIVAAVVVRTEPMLNPSRARKSHDLHIQGLLWMAHFHPMVLNGVELKHNNSTSDLSAVVVA